MRILLVILGGSGCAFLLYVLLQFRRELTRNTRNARPAIEVTASSFHAKEERSKERLLQSSRRFRRPHCRPDSAIPRQLFRTRRHVGLQA